MPRFEFLRHVKGHPRVATYAVVALILATLTIYGSKSVRADVRIQGDSGALQIDASQSSIAEVLASLGPNFNVRYRTSISLQEPFNGTYAGPLERVISQVLNGYNYVVKKNQAGIELIIIGKRGERAVAVERAKAPVAPSLAKQWRTPVEPKP